MIKSTILANSVATVVGIGYVLCRLIAAVAPNLLFTVSQSWFHTISLDSTQAMTSMTFTMFLIGLVSSVVVGWAASYAIAELYNRWAKE